MLNKHGSPGLATTQMAVAIALAEAMAGSAAEAAAAGLADAGVAMVMAIMVATNASIAWATASGRWYGICSCAVGQRGYAGIFVYICVYLANNEKEMSGRWLRPLNRAGGAKY